MSCTSAFNMDPRVDDWDAVLAKHDIEHLLECGYPWETFPGSSHIWRQGYMQKAYVDILLRGVHEALTEIRTLYPDYSPETVIDRPALRKMDIAISKITNFCKTYELKSPMKKGKTLIERFRGQQITMEQLIQDVSGLVDRVIDDLESSLFLHITEEGAEVYSRSPEFILGADRGHVVYVSCEPEILESQKCYAVEAYTAAMIHICRAAERIAFWVCLSAGIFNGKDQMPNTMGGYEGAIRIALKDPESGQANTPAGWSKTRRAQYVEFVSLFSPVREAHRNQSAHPGRVKPQDVKGMYETVRSIAALASSMLDQDGNYIEAPDTSGK